jgi:Kdo2-lipid IVA lauroyltransferase/acyltransferase
LTIQRRGFINSSHLLIYFLRIPYLPYLKGRNLKFIYSKLQNLTEYILFLIFSYFVKITGLRLSRKLSSILALIFFYVIPIRKRTVIKNLAYSFPEYSEKKIKKTAFDCYKSFSITLLELLAIPWLSREEMKQMVQCRNSGLIVSKFNEKKGIVLLSAHFGNWEYIALSVSLQIGIPFYVVVKPQRNPYVNKWLEDARTKWINEIIPSGISIRQVYKELLDRNIVAMVADQRGPREGVKLDFMGRPAYFFTGPAMLALKTGAPILYSIPVRQKDYSYKAEVYEVSKENLPEDENEKVIELTKRQKEYLEKFIRQYPEQWFWMHKRWKY